MQVHNDPQLQISCKLKAMETRKCMPTWHSLLGGDNSQEALGALGALGGGHSVMKS